MFKPSTNAHNNLAALSPFDPEGTSPNRRIDPNTQGPMRNDPTGQIPNDRKELQNVRDPKGIPPKGPEIEPSAQGPMRNDNDLEIKRTSDDPIGQIPNDRKGLQNVRDPEGILPKRPEDSEGQSQIRHDAEELLTVYDKVEAVGGQDFTDPNVQKYIREKAQRLLDDN